MSKSVLVASFLHETNTFSKTTTTRADFQSHEEYFGGEVPRNLAGTNTQIGGIIDKAGELDVDLVYTLSTEAVPGGRVNRDTYEFYAGEIVSEIRDRGDDLDAVMLALHGAMVPEGLNDGEGELLSRIREVIGEETPISVTLDLHANISDQMLELADCLVSYETYPHVDNGDTGREGMRILAEAMRGDADPVMAIERPPVLSMGPKQNTNSGPMAEVMAKARTHERRDNVLKVNVCPGFHKSDVPSMGFSITVVADEDPSVAQKVSRDLAGYVWSRRREFIADYPEPAEAVSQAKAFIAKRNLDGGPVLMADMGDNPGGGSPADGTSVLRELINQSVTNAGFAILCDSAAVERCIEAGVGEQITVTVGAKTEDSHGAPIEDLDGYVKAITDGTFVNTGPIMTGVTFHLGRAVHLQCGEQNGVSVILTERRVQPFDAEIWRHIGIQPERLDVIVVKSTNHYRADYEAMSSEVIPINSDGLSGVDPRKFEFANISRPIYPIDDMADSDYPSW